MPFSGRFGSLLPLVKPLDLGRSVASLKWYEEAVNAPARVAPREVIAAGPVRIDRSRIGVFLLQERVALPHLPFARLPDVPSAASLLAFARSLGCSLRGQGRRQRGHRRSPQRHERTAARDAMCEAAGQQVKAGIGHRLIFPWLVDI